MKITHMLEMFILRAGLKKAVSGKEICDMIEELTENEWKPAPGILYPLLKRMEKNGLIKSELKGEKRREIGYRTTDKGKKYLEKNKKNIRYEPGIKDVVMTVFVLHGMNKREIKKLMADMKILFEFKKKMLKLPEDKRKKIIFKLLEIVKENIGDKI